MNLGLVFTRAFGSAKYFVKKNSDKIELYAGMGCVALGTGMLIKDSNKIATGINDIQARVRYIKEADSDPDGWEDKEERTKYVHETARMTATTMVKNCWKGVGLIAVGEVLQGLSHATVSRKYQIANTALVGTSAAFSNYRENVIKDQGAEKDEEYLTGSGTMVTVEQKQDGTVTTTETPLHQIGDSRIYIPHSFFLGDLKDFYLTSGNNGNVGRALDQLQRELSWANKKAMYEGYIFENDVRKQMESDLTVAGQAAGMFYENPDKSVNRLTLMSHGIEIGDPRLLEGKPEDLLLEFKVVTTKVDGTTSLSNIEDNILDRIETEAGWLKC